ncbi:NAD(P)H-hydrate dehydratase [Candidatus Woesearchaeota archaeon]|nr:NAD(P)H-hydrate dehydratase [Candidatus Woesearchaeota archaeon]
MKFVSKKDIKIPKRVSSGKKGDNGYVLAIGGSEDFIGAVALAGLAALRCGCDGVHIATLEKVAWAVNCLSPDLVTLKLKGKFFSEKHVNNIVKLSKTREVLLIGNGLGIKKETKQFVKKIIRIKKPKVVDADGIKSVSCDDLESSIITPHIKELEIFLINSEIDKKIIKNIIKEKNVEKKALLIKKTLSASNFFKKNNVILLKGKIDTIIIKNKILFNKTGNAGMTKGGTGDVLAGLASGFLAQGLSLEQSAINAAYFTGKAGDVLLKKKKGFTYLASDLVEEIKKISRR